MRTYSEQRGKKPFDWNSFLDNAIHGNIEYQGVEHTKAFNLASEWVTCACGNQYDIIPRNSFGSPDDDVLCSLGGQFSIDIDDGLWKEAKDTLGEIEKRSKELIDQITNQSHE